MKPLITLVEDFTILDATPLKIDTGNSIVRGHWYQDHIITLMFRKVENYKMTDDGIMHIILA